MNLTLDMKDLRKLWSTLDEDKSGVISCEEFCDMVLGEHYEAPPGAEETPETAADKQALIAASKVRTRSQNFTLAVGPQPHFTLRAAA